MKRAILLAPIDTSNFSVAVLNEVLRLENIQVVGVVVRKITWNRVRHEWKRDGIRLLRKVFVKLVLRERHTFVPSQPDARDRNKSLSKVSLAALCQSQSIPLHTTININSDKTKEFIRKFKPDVGVFTGGGLIREGVLELFTTGVLNCHVGALPEYRGMDVIEWPFLVNQEIPQLGMTLHLMDKGVDTGPILEVKDLIVQGCYNSKEIRLNLEGDKINLIIKHLSNIEKWKHIKRTQQSNEGKQYFVLHKRLQEVAFARSIKYLKRYHENCIK